MNEAILLAAQLLTLIQPLTVELGNPQSLAECQKHFARMKELPDHPAVNQQIFTAYAEIVKGYGMAAMIREAEETYRESLRFPRREDMTWEQNYVTVKMIQAYIHNGQTEKARELTEKFTASVTDEPQDQAWLNYYMKDIRKAFDNPAETYGIPPRNENTTAETPTAPEPKEQTPVIPTWQTEGRDFWCGSDYEKHNDYAHLRKPNNGRNFWEQPGKYTPSTRPRTEEEIREFEQRMGYRLPELLRQQLKQQNGGTVRYKTYVHGNYADPILYEGNIQGIGDAYEKLSDTYGTYMDPEDWDEALGTGANPDRLYVLSYLDGHSLLCLDYGPLEPEPRDEPEVVHYYTETGFREQLRVPTYQQFIERLVYNETTYYVGLKTPMTLDQLKDHLTATLLPDPAKLQPAQKEALQAAHIDLHFERKEYAPHYIWDFDYHYVAMILSERKKFILRLMPNQYRGGNHVLQDDTPYNYILEIDPSDGSYGRAMAGPLWIEQIIQKIARPDIETKIILPEQPGQ